MLIPSNTKLIPSDTKLMPSWYQFDTMLLPCWYQVDAKRDQVDTKQYQVDTKLMLSWYQVDTKRDQVDANWYHFAAKRYHVDTKLILSWYQVDAKRYHYWCQAIPLLMPSYTMLIPNTKRVPHAYMLQWSARSSTHNKHSWELGVQSAWEREREGMEKRGEREREERLLSSEWWCVCGLKEVTK